MMRRWHFLLKAPLTPSEKAHLEKRLQETLQNWQSHGRPIAFEVTFPFDHFVAVTALTPVSGCAIDELFRKLLPLLNPLPSDYLAILSKDKVFIKSFYEIIKLKNEGHWEATWRLIEVVGDSLEVRPLEESGLRVHFC
jgi:hypothetical protein